MDQRLETTSFGMKASEMNDTAPVIRQLMYSSFYLLFVSCPASLCLYLSIVDLFASAWEVYFLYTILLLAVCDLDMTLPSHVTEQNSAKQNKMESIYINGVRVRFRNNYFINMMSWKPLPFFLSPLFSLLFCIVFFCIIPYYTSLHYIVPHDAMPCLI